ncbi:MAG: hypothetical protein IJW01_07745 [Paludibacteraceae bacterium]|nr:hypothetical protein [Paludibacteraceae bacterium]
MKEKLKNLLKKTLYVFQLLLVLIGIPFFVLGCLLRAAAWCFLLNWNMAERELLEIKRVW